MTVLLVATDPCHATAVRAAAYEWCHTVPDVEVERLDYAEQIDVAAVLRRLADDDVTMAVLPASGDPRDASWRVVRRALKPVLLVPHAYAGDKGGLRVALLPLDGTIEAAAAVSRTVELLSAAGVQLVLLHVFAYAKPPRYWDQGAHAQDIWESEFRSRFCAADEARITLRSGRPGEHVLAVAQEVDADLIALGWSQQLAEGRAATVRETVAHASVPVLLTPCVPDGVGRKPL